MAWEVLATFSFKRPSAHSSASSIAIFTPSPAYGGIRWAASPSMVRLGSDTQFWSKGMQYCGRGINAPLIFSNSSSQIPSQPANSFLNQADTCALSEKSIPLSLAHDSLVLQLV